jgi:hypothetical protein
MGWIIFAFILGAITFWLISWRRNKNLFPIWYEWLLGVVGVVSILAASQQYFGSLREDYLQAGLLGALMFGIIGLVFLATAWQFLVRRKNAA